MAHSEKASTPEPRQKSRGHVAPNRSARTCPAREAFLRRLENEVDPIARSRPTRARGALNTPYALTCSNSAAVQDTRRQSARTTTKREDPARMTARGLAVQ